MPKPVDIEHDTTRRVLTITWDDEVVSSYALGYLRAWCPCAECQGHGTVTKYLGEHDVGARDIEEVGAYAIKIQFSDGHDVGLYTWTWLHRLAAESEPKGLKTGSFSSGRFTN